MKSGPGLSKRTAHGAPRLSQQFALKVQDSAPTTTGRAATRDTHVSYKAIGVGIKPALLPAGMKSAVTRTYPSPLRFCSRTVEIRSGPRRSVLSALRILVADDHEVVRRGLCALLKSHDGWEVCAEAVDGREAVHKVNQLKPDIVILDIGMPNLNGLTAARQILHAHPQQKILILTMSDAEQIVREVLNAGARGFVLKSDAARDLLDAVDALERNRTFFTSRVAKVTSDGYRNASAGQQLTLPTVSLREREIVQLLAEGKSSKEVAWVFAFKRENNRDTPLEHHAQTGHPLHERVGALCRSQPYCSGSGWPTMT